MEKNQEHPDFDAVMADQAVTNIAGWTEPNNDDECDEETYRARLAKNGPIFQQIEALNRRQPSSRPCLLRRCSIDCNRCRIP